MLLYVRKAKVGLLTGSSQSGVSVRRRLLLLDVCLDSELKKPGG